MNNDTLLFFLFPARPGPGWPQKATIRGFYNHKQWKINELVAMEDNENVAVDDFEESLVRDVIHE